MNESPLSSVDPVSAAGAVTKSFEEAKTEFPEPPEPESDIVDLPGGLVRGDTVHRTVQVRELNGEDEEKIFRALASRNAFHLLDTILGCGVVRVGDLDEHESRKALPDLLIGDREAVLLGIRCMTYDDTVDVTNWLCPSCGEPTEVTLNLREDVEVRTLKDPAKSTTFTVKLRKGGTALVTMPTGADQAVVGENTERNIAERNTLLLQRCVREVDLPGGQKIIVAGFPSFVKGMGIKDRRSILEEIVKRQPGPQYTAVKFTHLSCGKEVTLGLDLADLFLS